MVSHLRNITNMHTELRQNQVIRGSVGEDL